MSKQKPQDLTEEQILRLQSKYRLAHTFQQEINFLREEIFQKTKEIEEKSKLVVKYEYEVEQLLKEYQIDDFSKDLSKIAKKQNSKR